MVMTEKQKRIFDKSKLVRTKKKLTGSNFFTGPALERKIRIGVKPALSIVGSHINSVLVAMGIVKRRKYEGRTKLTLVDQIPRLLVVCIDPDGKGSRKLFRDSGIKIVRSFRLNRRALLNCRLIGSADKFGQVRILHQLERRRREIARATRVNSSALGSLQDHVNSRAQLIGMRKFVDDIESRAEVDG